QLDTAHVRVEDGSEGSLGKPVQLPFHFVDDVDSFTGFLGVPVHPESCVEVIEIVIVGMIGQEIIPHLGMNLVEREMVPGPRDDWVAPIPVIAGFPDVQLLLTCDPVGGYHDVDRVLASGRLAWYMKIP